MCLDDEEPTDPGQRYTQFLLNGDRRPFSNRWLDKTLQFVVTANGLSAETYEHTKLDGLDARALHIHVLRDLYAQTTDGPAMKPLANSLCTIHRHTWNVSSAIMKQIENVSVRCKAYGPLDHQPFDAPILGVARLREARLAPNATAHLTVLLALYLVDGEIRAAWEKVSVGTFARGRVDFVQTVTPAARAFLEAAASAALRTTIGSKDLVQARSLLYEATAVHSRTIAAASRGRGAIGPLYALQGVAIERGLELPGLFHTRAWDHTRRGGPGQDVKLGFMRFTPSGCEVDTHAGNGLGEWDEAGFLVSGDRGVYVHCNVRETCAHFAISGKPVYVSRICEALDRAVDVVASLMTDGEV